jgi:hypothetical protein
LTGCSFSGWFVTGAVVAAPVVSRLLLCNLTSGSLIDPLFSQEVASHRLSAELSADFQFVREAETACLLGFLLGLVISI